MPRKPKLAEDLGLPKHMEARPRKGGGYSYRARMPDGSKIPLGWNLQEALADFHRLRGQFDTPTQPVSPILARHKKGALQRGIAFELTPDDVEQMLLRQAGRCAVTQREFSNEKPAGMRIRPWAASIDRKDSSRGYTADNCRLVCASVNVALNRFGDQMFTELIEALVRRVVREELSAMGVISRQPRFVSHGPKTKTQTPR